MPVNDKNAAPAKVQSTRQMTKTTASSVTSSTIQSKSVQNTKQMLGTSQQASKITASQRKAIHETGYQLRSGRSSSKTPVDPINQVNKCADSLKQTKKAALQGQSAKQIINEAEVAIKPATQTQSNVPKSAMMKADQNKVETTFYDPPMKETRNANKSKASMRLSRSQKSSSQDSLSPELPACMVHREAAVGSPVSETLKTFTVEFCKQPTTVNFSRESVRKSVCGSLGILAADDKRLSSSVRRKSRKSMAVDLSTFDTPAYINTVIVESDGDACDHLKMNSSCCASKKGADNDEAVHIGLTEDNQTVVTNIKESDVAVHNGPTEDNQTVVTNIKGSDVVQTGKTNSNIAFASNSLNTTAKSSGVCCPYFKFIILIFICIFSKCLVTFLCVVPAEHNVYSLC